MYLFIGSQFDYLDTIDLSGNLIKSLPSHAFSDFSGNQINLHGNPMSAIGTGAFTKLILNTLAFTLLAGELEYGEIVIECSISHLLYIWTLPTTTITTCNQPDALNGHHSSAPKTFICRCAQISWNISIANRLLQYNSPSSFEIYC